MKLTSKFKSFAVIAVSFLAGASVAVASMSVPVHADSPWENGMEQVRTGGDLPNVEVSGIVTNVINIILYAIGVLAIIMIVIGGIRYATSAGDQAAVTKAKNTILYGVVGLIIAVLAYAIVNFVLKAVGVNLN